MCCEQKYTGRKGQLKELNAEEYKLNTPYRIYLYIRIDFQF